MLQWTTFTSFVLSLILCVVNAVDLQFTNQPTSIVTKLGSTIYWNCKAVSDYSDKLDYRWTQSGSNIVGNGRRHTIHPNGTLIIRELQKSDLSRYECIVSDNVTTIQSGPIYLRLACAIGAPGFSETPQNATVFERETVTWRCVATGNPRPSVAWTKDGGALPSARVTFPYPGAMTLSEIEVTDAGLYTCTAQNSVGITQHFVSLNVQYGPSFTNPPPALSVGDKSNPLLLPCQARANPSPTYIWTLPSGAELTAPTTKGNFSVFDNGTLALKLPKETDSGTYTCRASNIVSIARALTQVFIRFSPRIISQHIRSEVVVGKAAILNCSAVGYPPPTFEWANQDQNFTVQNGEDFHIFSNGSLHVKKAKAWQEGLYTCSAVNAVGESNITVHLHVIVPPSFGKSEVVHVVKPSSDVSLTCTPRGSPELDLSWMKDGHALTLGSNMKLEGNYSLVIQKILPDQYGSYVCQVMNKAGNASKVFRIMQTDLPRFVISPSNQTVKEGTRLVLPCSASASWDQPDIQWYISNPYGSSLTLIAKENENYTSVYMKQGGQLIFENIKPTDRGWYKCSAENQAANISKLVFVEVLAMPNVEVHNETVASRPGDNVTLTCDVEDDIGGSVDWKKPRSLQIMMSTFTAKTSTGVSHSIVIENVTVADHFGNWSCTYCNDFGCVSKYTLLNVIGPPVILEADGVVTNKERRITCTVTGVTPVTTTYYWGDLYINPLMPSSGHTVDLSGPSLIISKSIQSSTTYKCKVENRYGTDELKMRVPGPCRNLSVSAEDEKTVNLDWVSGHFGGLKTTNMNIEYQKLNTTEWFTITNVNKQPVSVGGLEPFTNYQFRVWTENALGDGVKTISGIVKTKASAPGSPTDVKARMVGNRTAALTWKTPEKINGYKDDIIYEIQWQDLTLSSAAVSITNIPLDSPQVTLNNVTNRSTIRVSLRAVNTAEEKKSQPVTVTFTAVSAAPVIFPNITSVDSSSPTSIKVTWEVYSKTEIIGYVLSCRPTFSETAESYKIIIKTTETDEYVLNNLTAGTTYIVQMAAYNDFGIGAYGYPVSVTTQRGIDSSEADQGLSPSTIAIIAGILAALVLVILVILAALKCRRKATKKALRSHQTKAPSQIYNNPTLVDTGGSRKSGVVGMYDVARRNKKVNNGKVNHLDAFTISNKVYDKSPWGDDMWFSQEDLAAQRTTTVKDIPLEEAYSKQKEQFLYGPKAKHVAKGKKDNIQAVYDDHDYYPTSGKRRFRKKGEVTPGVPYPPEGNTSIPNLHSPPLHPSLAHLYDEIDLYQSSAAENYRNVKFMSLPRSNVPRTNPYLSHSSSTLPGSRYRPPSVNSGYSFPMDLRMESELPVSEFSPNVDRPGLLAINLMDDDILKNYRV